MGKLNASWVEDMVALWLRVLFEVDEENRLVNQLISGVEEGKKSGCGGTGRETTAKGHVARMIVWSLADTVAEAAPAGLPTAAAVRSSTGGERRGGYERRGKAESPRTCETVRTRRTWAQPQTPHTG